MVRYPLVSRHCQIYAGARWTWVRTSHQLVYHLRFTARRQRASSANGILPSYKEEEGFAHIHNNNFETRTNLQGAFQEHICSRHFRLLSDQNPARLFHFYCPRRGLTDSRLSELLEELTAVMPSPGFRYEVFSLFGHPYSLLPSVTWAINSLFPPTGRCHSFIRDEFRWPHCILCFPCGKRQPYFLWLVYLSVVLTRLWARWWRKICLSESLLFSEITRILALVGVCEKEIASIAE